MRSTLRVVSLAVICSFNLCSASGLLKKKNDICACCFLESLQGESIKSVSLELFSYAFPKKNENNLNEIEVFDSFCKGIKTVFLLIFQDGVQKQIIKEAVIFLSERHPELKREIESRAAHYLNERSDCEMKEEFHFKSQESCHSHGKSTRENASAFTSSISDISNSSQPLFVISSSNSSSNTSKIITNQPNSKCAFAVYFRSIHLYNSELSMTSMMQIFQQLMKNLSIQHRERAFLVERERFIYYLAIQKHLPASMNALDKQKLIDNLDSQREKVRIYLKFLVLSSFLILGCIFWMFCSMTTTLFRKGLIQVR